MTILGTDRSVSHPHGGVDRSCGDRSDHDIGQGRGAHRGERGPQRHPVKPADPTTVQNSVTGNPEAVAIGTTVAELPPKEAAEVLEDATRGMTADQKNEVYAEVVTQAPEDKVVDVAKETQDPEKVEGLKDAAHVHDKDGLAAKLDAVLGELLPQLIHEAANGISDLMREGMQAQREDDLRQEKLQGERQGAARLSADLASTAALSARVQASRR